MKSDKERMEKAIAIIGDDYPTYEDIVTKAHEEIDAKEKEQKNSPTEKGSVLTSLSDIFDDQSEMEEQQHGTYEHMLDTFDWWQEYLAQQGPEGIPNISSEIIKYADKLKQAAIAE